MGESGGAPSQGRRIRKLSFAGCRMDERCVGCPWFDPEEEVCYRRPPRFCEVDESALGVGSAIGLSGIVDLQFAIDLADASA